MASVNNITTYITAKISCFYYLTNAKQAFSKILKCLDIQLNDQANSKFVLDLELYFFTICLGI